MTTHRPARVLLLDGSPGATTVLLLAAPHVLDPIEHVLSADTGLYPASTERYLKQVHTLCGQAGAELVRADATGIAERAWSQSPAPLPLFTLDRYGTTGRLRSEERRVGKEGRSGTPRGGAKTEA